MTESEWLACDDPTNLLLYLGRRGTRRKLRLRFVERRLRLFAVACCRRIWPFIASVQSRNAIIVAEKFADDEATTEELQAAEADAEASWLEKAGDDARIACRHVCAKDMTGFHVNHLSTAVLSAVFERIQTEANQPFDPLDGRKTGACLSEDRAQCGLLRCIFGNPFHPVSISSASLTPTVTSLAQTAYEARSIPSGELDPDRLAVLSDALADAGCDDADILNHLRSPGPHVRGCWAVDLLLGKE